MDESQMIRLVRGFVADTNPENQLFSDQDVSDVLAMYTGKADQVAVKRAASELLYRVAASEVLISKKITTQDLATDGPAVSAELRALAARLRKEADDEDDDADAAGFFHIVPGGPFRPAEGEETRWLP